MFTGIVKAVGEIERIEPRDGDLRMTISSPTLPWQEFSIGESISVNGVCLTAVAYEADAFLADVSLETATVTTLADLREGSKVNLEPSVSLGERLGGHLVSGHVDCVGTVVSRDVEARSVRFSVAVPSEVRRYIAKKGSICIDGTSLTVNEVEKDLFTTNIIPHPADATISGNYIIGSRVNIEVDLVARYLEALLGAGDTPKLSKKFLEAHGYA